MLLTYAQLDPTRLCSKSELVIKLENDAEIHVVGLDEPSRIEGVPWDGGVIDEIADTKPKTWESHVYPALNTENPLKPNYAPWCWLIGVAEGRNHYYDLAEYARTAQDPEWGYYSWYSSAVLSADKIAAAQRVMDPMTFRQEYEASFEQAEGVIYADYGEDNAWAADVADYEQLHWMHDFNYVPLSSAIGVVRDDALHIGDEIVLRGAVARQSAMEFVDRYRHHRNKDLMLYGDPAGKAGEKHRAASDYTEIEAVLRQCGWKVTRCVRKAAPAIKDRQNAVRCKIKNAAGDVSLYVDRYKAPTLHAGLTKCELIKGSTFLEREDDNQHITTALGYCIDWLWPMRRVIEEPAPPPPGMTKQGALYVPR